MIATEISLVNTEVSMAAQTPVRVSTFQYWRWKLKSIPTPYLLLLDVIFLAVFFLSTASFPTIPKEWYPGGVKIYPTIRVIVPSTVVHPTIPAATPLPIAQPEEPAVVDQPAPVEVPQAPVVAEQPAPTVVVPTEQPTQQPTASQ